MCGRYTLRTPPAELAQFFGLFREPDVLPRYDVAPTQTVVAIRLDEDATPCEDRQLANQCAGRDCGHQIVVRHRVQAAAVPDCGRRIPDPQRDVTLRSEIDVNDMDCTRRANAECNVRTISDRVDSRA